uniref:pyrroloquinoline quinone biosynthesis protein PqqE n=1 Tax=Castellaniella defragrans TaxID=75697 RepID=UPI00333EB42C
MMNTQTTDKSAEDVLLPLAITLELTHRCPLACPYCSNPVELLARDTELPESTWREVIDQAAELGALQVHFTGGEPVLHPGLVGLVAHVRELNLYSNLITSGIGLRRQKLDALVAAGLDHLQLSIQDSTAQGTDYISGRRGSFARKLEVASWCRDTGVSFTLNAVVHGRNMANLGDMIQLAVDMGVHRLEIAHVQYHGWALRNRAALMPTQEQVLAADALVREASARLAGQLVIVYVAPDYYSESPKPCMGGWGRRMMTIAPDGRAMPCHAASSIPGMTFPRVDEHPLRWIWTSSEAFMRYRGTAWMPEPCASCELRERDWGGCRCQALALAGDAGVTDPTCSRSPLHDHMRALAQAESQAPAPAFVYRRAKRGGRDDSAI